MDDLGFNIARLFGFIFPLLWVGCCIAAIVKFRGRLSATLAGIGFGLIGLTGLMYHMPWYEWGFSTLYMSFIGLLNFAGIILVLAAIICLRFPAGDSATARYPMAPQANTTNALEKPRHQPAWGLVTAWIALSALNWLLGIVLLGLVADAGSYISSREWKMIMPLGIANILVTIPGIIVFLIWLYRSWDAISPRYRSFTPGRAIGFLFIPIFNIYWAFRVIPGLSAAIRKSRESLGSQQIGGAGYGVGIAACIIAFIPYVGILSWPFFVIWIILANKEKNRMLLEQQAAFTQDRVLQTETEADDMSEKGAPGEAT